MAQKPVWCVTRSPRWPIRSQSGLANTRTVCRKYYIHPVVLDAYRRGRVLPPLAEKTETVRRKSQPRLRHHESEVMQFIQENQS